MSDTIIKIVSTYAMKGLWGRIFNGVWIAFQLLLMVI
jgi:hypothetical protein